MFSLSKFLKPVWTLLARAEPRHEVDESYLAESVDIYDLERRMRALDERGRHPLAGMPFGLYPR